jgi:adenine C2-methylase RlmN of 23S rRNA A2503 and tRNA A37
MLRVTACMNSGNFKDQHKIRAKEFIKHINQRQMKRFDAMKIVKKDIFHDIKEMHIDAMRFLNKEIEIKIVQQEDEQDNEIN